MNIIVCIKQIMDPEIPTGKFKIDPEANRVIPSEGIPPVINPFDAQAIEVALRLKEANGANVTAITVGGQDVEDVVRYAISMGVDEGILVSDEAFKALNSFVTAFILSRAISRIGQYDLILCGRQAADRDAGHVGLMLGEMLNLPIITMAKAVTLSSDKFRVEHVITEGYQVYEVGMPALITISDEIGPPRRPSGWGVIAAAMGKEIPTWSAQDIGVNLSDVDIKSVRSETIRLFIPDSRRKGEVIQGNNVAEASANLMARLRADGII
ncbi:MAG: electron transfer flavoprotein subunit beta/FixA family protein [Desulfobulbaceae bacterium]|nr:electron transfer flavoprotein subunit beta/FixA family protein [Desulfobulbaceae bacterium]